MRKLMLGLLICTAGLAETDVSGKWVGSIFHVNFQQDGSRLTGTVGRDDKDQYPLKNGKIDGDRVTFELSGMQFDLRVEGASIKGVMKSGEETHPVVLQRAEALKSAGPAAFEVASVKPSPPSENRGSNMRLDVGRLTCSGVTLKNLMQRAYDVKPYQISGPDWLDEQRYELSAKFPGTYTVEQITESLQTLLVERFKLTVRRENRDMAVYGLVVGKSGFKLQPVEFGPGGTSSSKGKMTGRKIPLTALAATLSARLDRPVIDMTGIAGLFDFTLEWAPDEKQSSETGPTVDLYTAVEQQLGLKLENRRAPVEMLIVEHAEKVPIEN